LVEHLGSGIPRILQAYSQDCFSFTENFIRMSFPNAWNLGEERDEKIETFTHEAPIEAPVEAPVDQMLANNINFNNKE